MLLILKTIICHCFTVKEWGGVCQKLGYLCEPRTKTISAFITSILISFSFTVTEK